jgi:lycopene beta-cyclase
MSEKYQFLSILGLCLLIVLPLESLGAAQVLRRPRELFVAILGPFVLLSVLNEVAVNRELWRYSPRFVSGVFLPRRYPIEEVVFLVVLPICASLIFAAASNRLRSQVARDASVVNEPRHDHRLPLATFLSGLLLASCGLLLLIELWIERNRFAGVTNAGDRFLRGIDWDVPEYPVLTFGLIAGVLFLEAGFMRTGIFRMRAYWFSLAVLLVIVSLVNVWLSKASAPIVVYSQDELIGLRPLGYMPIEDIGFDLAGMTLVMMSWLRVTRERFTR